MHKPERILAGLLREGSLAASGPGQFTCAGRYLAVCRFFDAGFRAMAARRRAHEHAYPSLIPVKFLEQLEYFSSFPQLATFATHAKARHPDHVLSPAICYHTCRLLRNRQLTSVPYCVTAAGPCFRFEGAALAATPERLWNFTMREVVFFGSPQQVERLRRSLMVSAHRLAAAAGLNAVLEEASDPFFLGAARGKLLLQRLKKLKYELRVGGLALASFNKHEDFFTGRLNIRLPGGEVAHSGCAAFGIERWAWAFFCRLGLDDRRWPPRLQRYVSTFAAC